jgi:hypothetical protein
MRSSAVIPRCRLAWLVCAVFVTCGCGSGKYPVRGRVTLDDGTTLTRGMVVFESLDGKQGARGMIQPDGRYELSSAAPGDGVRPGRYRVLVSALDLTDVPDEKKTLPFDLKYTRFETSGLEVEVKAHTNDVPIELRRPARRPK